MTRRVLLCAWFALALAACGDDGAATPDAPKTPDASTTTIMVVDPCPATPDATITTLATRFEPMTTTITQGQVVKFESTSTHPILPNGAMTDPGLTIGEGQTKCLRFTAAGTFGFRCEVHGYVGSITVN